jgi:hypothetical protein
MCIRVHKVCVGVCVCMCAPESFLAHQTCFLLDRRITLLALSPFNKAVFTPMYIALMDTVQQLQSALMLFSFPFRSHRNMEMHYAKQRHMALR